MNMNTEEFVKRLNALDKTDGEEDAHRFADEILLEALEANGMKDVADAWRDARKRITFWYV